MLVGDPQPEIQAPGVGQRIGEGAGDPEEPDTGEGERKDRERAVARYFSVSRNFTIARIWVSSMSTYFPGTRSTTSFRDVPAAIFSSSAALPVSLAFALSTGSLSGSTSVLFRVRFPGGGSRAGACRR